MKLKELMITPEKPLKEEVSISADKHGVHVGIDDYDDVLITGKNAGLYPAELQSLVDALACTTWFKRLVINASKRGVRIINMVFTNDGISFR